MRLRGHNYRSAGACLVTICTQRREWLFGRIVDGALELNDIGKTVMAEWARTPTIRPEIGLDAFVVMPDHLHGIVVVKPTVGATDHVGAHGRAPLRPHRTPRSLGSLVAGFKSATAKRINAMRGTPGAAVWQRNYHDRVVRDEDELNRIRAYVADNPSRWRHRRD